MVVWLAAETLRRMLLDVAAHWVESCWGITSRERLVLTQSALSTSLRGRINVADKTDLLLQLYAEERAQARQSEAQRATLTNIIIVIAGGGLAFISDQKLGDDALVLSVGIVIPGVFGAVANAKYYERWFRHWVRAYAYREQLVRRYPEIEVHRESFGRKPTYDRKYVYESEIDEKYRRSRLHKLPLNRLWVGLNLIVAVGGTVLTVIILTQN